MIYSYVVRYDSGFAPNPFYGYCTLATCKPQIRVSASVGDWIVGCGSNNRTVQLGDHLVYAMKVSECLSFDQYDRDPRFQSKKPHRRGSRKQSCGDNIYSLAADGVSWIQRDSFHSLEDGSPNPDHIAKDTRTNRVLVSEDYVYFGGEGPSFPSDLMAVSAHGRPTPHILDPELIEKFVRWIRSLGVSGYQGAPFEFQTLRRP